MRLFFAYISIFLSSASISFAQVELTYGGNKKIILDEGYESKRFVVHYNETVNIPRYTFVTRHSKTVFGDALQDQVRALEADPHMQIVAIDIK